MVDLVSAIVWAVFKGIAWVFLILLLAIGAAAVIVGLMMNRD